MEWELRDNAVWQVFCGRFQVISWHIPDHTKIERFRNRLSPETQRILVNELCSISVKLGFGDPKITDFDSMVQEANMSYPADASLMKKLAQKCAKVMETLKERAGEQSANFSIDLK